MNSQTNVAQNLSTIIATEFAACGFVRVNLTEGYVIELERYESGNIAVVLRAPVSELCPYGSFDLIYRVKKGSENVAPALSAMMARIVEWMRPKTEAADLAPF